MTGVSSVVHLFSLLVFFGLIFFGIILKKRINLLKCLMLSGTNHAKTKVVVDWPIRLLKDICDCLEVNYESSVSYKRSPPGKIQLDVLSKFIKEYSISKIICRPASDDSGVDIVFISNIDFESAVLENVRASLGGQVGVNIIKG